MPMYCGVSGAKRKISKLFTGIGGAKKEITEMWAGENGAKKKIFSSGLPIGTQWVFEENGTFVVPQTGKYEIELHGGGGSAFSVQFTTSRRYCSGGGSGEIYTADLVVGTEYAIEVGKNSWLGGGPTKFGELFTVKGGSQKNNMPQSSGSLATNGTYKSYWTDGDYLQGGLGNRNKPSQKYGNGGDMYSDSSGNPVAGDGEDGAAIITLIG